MAVDHVKSTFVTNADANPAVMNTAGEGASGLLKAIEGSAVGVAASSIDATYQFVRVPSNCKVKKLFFESGAQAAGTIDIGLYFATDGQGGRPLSLLAAAAINRTFFTAAYALTAASGPTDITNVAGTSNYTIDKRTQPLWQAAGLTSDPGGFFDIVGTLAVAITTGTGRMGLEVFYVD